MKLLSLLGVFALGGVYATAEDPWRVVTEAIEDYNIARFAVVVANESGIQYVYEKGNASWTGEVMNVASTTKWVSGAMIMRVIATGKLHFNDYVYQHLPFWTKDPKDSRSRIQLHHLLGFTSGYYNPGYGANVKCFRNSSMDYVDCVHELYDTVKHRWEPGTTFDYSSLHLKIAGGMAVAASGKDIRTLLEDTLRAAGMKNSYYDMDNNPELAGSLWTTGEDYNSFLESIYYHRLFPSRILEEFETDHTLASKVKPSKKTWGLSVAVGHYAQANWLDCDSNFPTRFRPECYEKSVHTSPGVFGYWPAIDRYGRYWYQIVYNGPPVSGCIDGWAARSVLQPLIDAVMNGEKPPKRPSRPEIDVIKQRLISRVKPDLLALWPL